MKLSEKIYALRTARGLSQGDLAEKLEVSRQSVSKWETGQSVPDLDKIIKLADLFGVSVDELVREDAMPAPPPEPHIIYVDKPKKTEALEKKELSPGCIISAVLLGTLALTLLAFVDGGSIEDETGVCLAVASVVFAIELLVFRRHPWATVWWTLVGFLPFIIICTVWRIDRSIQALMIVIGLTAAAFGLFLTYRKKP